tara:strand:- start:3618 stop:3821 length:204 start_codon:yes stop_codon:yes gene_type:complete
LSIQTAINTVQINDQQLLSSLDEAAFDRPRRQECLRRQAVKFHPTSNKETPENMGLFLRLESAMNSL